MATIIDPQLTIQVDNSAKVASVRVTCDVEFTQFEVNSMNLLGMRYTL